MLNCIALDDEPMALEVIKVHCNRLSYINLTHTFTQASKAAKHLRKFPVDLIFLDIQMPDINGIDFYKNLQQDTMVIFTTAFSEYAIEGFKVNAVDYLLKPIEFDPFQLACERAKEFSGYFKNTSPKENSALLVRSEYALVKIPFSDILYLETMDDYIKIHSKSSQPILTLMSMKKMVDKLPKDNFTRVHRSYTIQLKEITGVRGKTIFIDDITIPLGKTYESDFFSIFGK